MGRLLIGPGFLLAILVAGGCAGADRRQEAPNAPGIEGPTSPSAATTPEKAEDRLAILAESDRQWTGVAASREGRIFVNYPRWSEQVPVSVAEVTGFREVRPYPDTQWNRWEPSLDPGEHFVCVQSVVVDDENFLWVLDPANPRFAGVVAGGPKLVKIDLGSNRVAQVIRFGPEVAPAASYLNDVRIDTGRQIAYITDSGSGALLVVDLNTGRTRRLLAEHPSTRSEGIILTVGGLPWLRDGQPPQIHADGLALSPDREYLYYQALTGRHIYRIATRWLRDEYLSPGLLGEKVELLGETGAADGLLFAPDGNLYLTAIEADAIRRLTPDGKLETVAQDERLRWPDSFARTPAGELLVTTSQIHYGANPPEPYRIFRVKPQ